MRARPQVYAEKYADDQAAFFADYAKSHKKLSEQGAKFSPAEVREQVECNLVMLATTNWFIHTKLLTCISFMQCITVRRVPECVMAGGKITQGANWGCSKRSVSVLKRCV